MGAATWDRRPIVVPPVEIRTVALDLDETLVHTSMEPLPRFDYIIKIHEDGAVVDAYVAVRPGAREFIRALQRMRMRVYVFTAGTREYASAVMNQLVPGWPQSRLLTREDCTEEDYNGHPYYVKDLEKLDPTLKTVVIVENSPWGFARQPENGILVGSWVGDDPHDTELMGRVLPILCACKRTPDVRGVIRECGANQAPQPVQ